MLESNRIAITLIEDNPDDADIIEEYLNESSQFLYQIKVYETLAEAIAHIKETPSDIILTDLGLPDSQGLSTLTTLREQAPDIPVIVLTGFDDEEMGIAAVAKGSQDYIVKGDYHAALLNRAIKYAIQRHQMESELRRHHDHLEEIVAERTQALRITNQQSEYEIEQRIKIEQALNREHQFLEQIINTSPNPIYVMSVDGYFMLANQKAAELFNTSVDQLVGKSYEELADESDDWEKLLAADSQIIETGDTISLPEVEITDENTKTTYLQMEKAPLYDSSGKIRAVLTIATDITALKVAEHTSRQQQIVAEILRETILAMASSLEPDQVMEKILDQIGKLVPHDAANIMLIEDSHARIRYSRGYEPDLKKQIHEEVFSLELSNLKDIIMQGKPYIIRDVQYTSKWDSVSGNPWIRAYLGVPIKVQGQTIGFLNLDSMTPGFFTQQHADNLQIFAEQAAIAIHNAQLYEALRISVYEMQRLQRASDLLFTSFSSAQSLKELSVEIATAIVQSFSFVDVSIILNEPGSDHLIRIGRAGKYSKLSTDEFISLQLDGPGMIVKAITNGEIVYAPDVTQESEYIASIAETRSELVIPMKTNKRVIGVLDFQSPKRDAFSHHFQDTLAAFAERVATVIENLQLYEAIQVHANQLEQRVQERTGELRRSVAQAEAILNAINNSIVIIDSEGRIANTNPAFFNNFGYVYKEWFRIPIHKIFEDGMQITQALEQTIDSTKPKRIETLACRKDGSKFMAEVTFALIHNDQDNGEKVTEHLVCNIHDISYYKEVQQIKDNFVEMVSHELRTPITGLILSSNSLLKYHDRLSEEQKKQNMEKINRQSTVLGEMVESILGIAQLESGIRVSEPRIVKMDELIKSLVEEVQNLVDNKNQTLTLEFIEIPLLLRCDPSDLGAIWRNLISNAIKYTPDEGMIWIRAGKMSASDGAIKIANEIKAVDLPQNDELVEGDYVVGQIEDNGYGISPDDLEHIFERFNRGWAASSAISGTGLGLAFVKQLIEIYHGGIRVSSTKNKGSLFTFWIPREYRI